MRFLGAQAANERPGWMMRQGRPKMMLKPEEEGGLELELVGRGHMLRPSILHDIPFIKEQLLPRRDFAFGICALSICLLLSVFSRLFSQARLPSLICFRMHVCLLSSAFSSTSAISRLFSLVCLQISSAFSSTSAFSRLPSVLSSHQTRLPSLVCLLCCRVSALLAGLSAPQRAKCRFELKNTSKNTNRLSVERARRRAHRVVSWLLPELDPTAELCTPLDCIDCVPLQYQATLAPYCVDQC